MPADESDFLHNVLLSERSISKAKQQQKIV